MTSTDAARYFDLNLAAACRTDMRRCLLASDVAWLRLKVADLHKRLFIDTL